MWVRGCFWASPASQDDNCNSQHAKCWTASFRIQSEAAARAQRSSCPGFLTMGKRSLLKISHPSRVEHQSLCFNVGHRASSPTGSDVAARRVHEYARRVNGNLCSHQHGGNYPLSGPAAAAEAVWDLALHPWGRIPTGITRVCKQQ